jgi:hypothetical protein
MTRIAFMGIVLAGTLLAPTTGFAQISCSREGLQRAADLYIAAQTKGDTSGLPLATGLGYVENHVPAKMDEGVIKTTMKIDHHRSLLDPATCQTFTEVIVTNKDKPYVLGTAFASIATRLPKSKSSGRRRVIGSSTPTRT